MGSASNGCKSLIGRKSVYVGSWGNRRRHVVDVVFLAVRFKKWAARNILWCALAYLLP